MVIKFVGRWVCANPSCPVHHPKQQTSRDDEKWKADQEKQRREQAIANTTGLRVLAAIASAVPVRLVKRDLLFVIEKLVGAFELLHRQIDAYPEQSDSGFVSLGTGGARSVGSPASVSWGNGASNGPRSDTLVYDSNGDLQWIWSDDGKTFNWYSLGKAPDGGVFFGRPAIAAPKPRRLDIFATVGFGATKSLYHRAWENLVDYGWELWVPPPESGTDNSPASSPSAVGWTVGVVTSQLRVDVFYVSAANELRFAFTSADWGFESPIEGDWNTWGNGGFVLTGDPTVVSSADGRLDVYVAEGRGSLLHAWWDKRIGGNPTWEVWTNPGPGVSALDLVSPGACAIGDRSVVDWVIAPGADPSTRIGWQTVSAFGNRTFDGVSGTPLSAPTGRFACSTH